MSLDTRPRSPRPSIRRVKISHNGGPWHDGPPQRARPRAETEEEGQGGRRTPPRSEEPQVRQADGSVAPQPPERALGCYFGLNLTKCTEPQRRRHQQGELCWPLGRTQPWTAWVRLSED